MDRPRIDPETPGGMSLWMGYLSAKLESIEARQNRQNGSVDRLVERVGQLPCMAHDDRLTELERMEHDYANRAYNEARDAKQNIRLFIIKAAVALITFGLGALATYFVSRGC